MDELTTPKDLDILADIMGLVLHVADHAGYPDQRYAKRVHGTDLCKIRSKYRYKEVIRIYYFIDKQTQKMFLLNYVTKPDGSNAASKYEGGTAKKIRKQIQESVAIAEMLKEQYPSDHLDYEPYSQD